MKNLLFTLIALVISFNIFATNYTEGVEFIKIQNKIQNQHSIIEFFSFYCPYCYEFESIYRVSQTIAKNLPKDIKIKRYHVDFLGPLGKELTKAWAIAMVLNIENKMISLLFEGIQNKKSIKTSSDIKSIFIKAGIKNKEYDKAFNSIIVKSLVIKQQKAAEDFQLQGVPAIFINGKYMICNNSIITKNINNYSNIYYDIVKFLINK
ncbi:MAG: thiol:disulfide interchange protein DsbA [Arsenophonus endosymbiont of Ceratovacuna japonica]